MADMPYIEGSATALASRGISEETCKKFSYQVGIVPADHPLTKWRGQTVQIENYYNDEGSRIGQKLRGKNKTFGVIGKVSTQLFGRKCTPAGGKVLVITEGAIDALSYAEVRKNWPVVSIPNGVNTAAKTLEANLEYIESFEKVILCFDNDDAGQTAANECKGTISPGKLYIAKLNPEFKDFNEALKGGDVKSILNAVFEAEEVRPDGLVDMEDILEEALRPVEFGLPWFIPELTALTYGRRYGEIYALGAGTGVGKTDIFTEQVNYDVTTLDLHVGLLFLEQKPAETAKRVAGKYGNRRFHVPESGWSREELVESITALKGKVTFYDSFGQTEWSGVKVRIRHMNKAKGIRVFYLDHLTAMADTSDEKGSIEQIMKEMAGLANELNIIIHFISHLATPDGTPHEEGGRVMIRHFKGSRSIGFWSFYMFGLERDQQAEDEAMRSITTFRVLKDRYTGQATGHTFHLGYDAETGRIILPSAVDMPDPKKDEEF